MRSWFQRFMSGRYGFDQLGGFLCVVSFILVIVGAWVSPVLYWLGLILLIYSYFRVLSRNRSKRYAENLKYLTLQNKVVDWANRYILRFNQRKQYRYFRCTVHADSKACPGCGCVKLHELEAVVYRAMVKKLKDFKTLTGRNKAAKISPKLTAKRLELAQVESEIEKLLDTLTGASPVLLSYANSKIEELDARRQSIANEIAKLSADAVPMEKMESISGYLDDWENVSFEDKRQVVDALITVIRATNEKVEIEWKI